VRRITLWFPSRLCDRRIRYHSQLPTETAHIQADALNEPFSARPIGLLVGGLIATAIAVYWPISVQLWGYWLQPYDGGQGFLVAALSLWLIVRARGRLAAAPVRPCPWAILLLIPASIAALILWRAGIQSLHFLLLPALMMGAVLTAFGPAVARILLVPIGFLYFSMPAWEQLTPLLQGVTVRVVGALAPLVGLPASVHGMLLAFPDGTTFEVTALCAGVGLLVQGLAVATLLGELEVAPLARRLKLFGSMVIVALVANWVRVLIIIYAGYTTGMRHIIVQRHLLFGWLFFVCVLVAYVWLASRSRVDSAAAAGTAPAARQLPTPLSYALAVAALSAVPLLVYAVAPTQDPSGAAATLHWPAGSSQWHGPNSSADGFWQPRFVGQHVESEAAYRDAAGREVEILAIGYPVQDYGRKLVSEGNSLLGAGVRQLTGRVVDGSGQLYYEMVVADGQGGQSVIWYVYDIGGRSFVIPVYSQLWYGVRALSAQPYSVLFALRARCDSSCSAARETLNSFVQGMGSQLRASAAAAH
jgi:EpsI family protein